MGKMKRGEPVNCIDTLELRWNAWLGFRDVDPKKFKAAKKLADQLGEEFNMIPAEIEVEDAPKDAKAKAKDDAKEEDDDEPELEIKPADPNSARMSCFSPVEMIGNV